MHILAHRLRATLRLAMLAAAACAPIVGHAQVAIEQQPLIVVKPLPPNVLLILDNSGSMAETFMPDSAPSGNINRTTWPLNTLAYNPLATYLPWYKADGTLMPNVTATNAVATTVSNHADLASFTTSTINLASAPRCFHTPQTSASNSGLYLWRFNQSGSGNSGRISHLDRCAANNSCSNPSGSGVPSGCTRYTLTSTITWNHGSTPVSRTVLQEWQNYANWYHYYRTRMKMAKGSASRAFVGLGEDFRIGFTTIGLNTTNTFYRIPVATDNGLFKGGNRSAWFDRLHNSTQVTGGSTPLREALGDAGEYFREDGHDGPWGPEAGSDQLSCRQNFSILTTDGYWGGNPARITGARANNDSIAGPTHITADGTTTYTYAPARPYTDTYDDTLADVAMYYWKNDLRTDLPNNVPNSASNPAFWQHMVTFGVSIGEKGQHNPATDLPAIAAGTKHWWPGDTHSGPTKKPSLPTQSVHTIDDLWHATVNSRGEFIVASDADEFANALQSALGTIASRLGSGGSLGGNEATQFGNNAYSFQAQYWSGSWRGELSAYEILSNGRLATDPTWVASDQLPFWSARQIYVHDRQHASSKYKSFTWANLSHSAQSALGSADVLEYLRGNRSKEQSQPGGTLRTRGSALGDIVNSQPVYVGPPSPQLYQVGSFSGATGYQTFVTQKKDRDPILYVGANDGMLHGFDANTGEETYAFIPNAVLAHLKHLADPDYKHRYFVDGELTVADAYDAGNGWKTILIGTLGRGGRGVFALDVTDPQGVQFLWERDASDIPALGNNLGKPIIAQVANGDWRVLIGNGPNGSGNRAQLIMIDVFSGAVTTADSGEIGSQGLSAVRAWDADNDGFTDTAYAGDFDGNLWRIRGLPDEPEFEKLFQAQHSGKAQPITAAPLVGINPSNDQTWVFFGTGRYVNETDLPNKDVQTWYGLIDRGEEIASRAELLQRNILADGTVGGFPVRTITQGTVSDLAGKSGWYIDLVPPNNDPVEGERMVLPNRFGSGALIGVTRIPDGSNACNPSGRGWVYAIHPFSGVRLALIFFDLTRDSLFNSADTLNGAAPSALSFDAGLTNPLLFLSTMQFSLDDGRRESIRIQSQSRNAIRQSWREILGN